MQALEYAVRPTRAEGSPRLRGLYIFGPRDSVEESGHRSNEPGPPAIGSILSSEGAQIGSQWNSRSKEAIAQDSNWYGDKWYQQSGLVLAKQPTKEWAQTLATCEGIISFDTVLCNGPRHQIQEIDQNSPWYHQPPYHNSAGIASFAVGRCSGCSGAPEGVVVYNKAPLTSLPLLSPLPANSSTLKAATKPSSVNPLTCMVARCIECIRHRHCNCCKKWWCEDCYDGSDRVADQSYSLQQAGIFNPPSISEATTGNFSPERRNSEKIKVHMGLCVEDCLYRENISCS
jgi:hypothetical protein